MRNQRRARSICPVLFLLLGLLVPMPGAGQSAGVPVLIVEEESLSGEKFLLLGSSVNPVKITFDHEAGSLSPLIMITDQKSNSHSFHSEELKIRFDELSNPVSLMNDNLKTSFKNMKWVSLEEIQTAAPRPGLLEYALYNIRGKKVLTGFYDVIQAGPVSITLHGWQSLSAGIYSLVVRLDGNHIASAGLSHPNSTGGKQ